MATTIELKNSVTTGNSPSTLAQGEMGVNITDKKVWIGNASSTPIQLIGAGASMSLTSLTTSSDASISGLTVGKGGGSVASNTAVGVSALGGGSQTGTFNTAVGSNNLSANTSGSQNTMIGNNCGVSNTTGSFNSFVGQEAFYNNTTGSYNTGLGRDALANNTTASNNTAVGYQAGYTNSTGVYNTFIGWQSGYTSNVSGNALNTCVGVQSGYSLTTGSANSFFGCGTTGSGYLVTTGSKNTIIGAYSGNQGGLDIRTASNYIVLSDGDGNPTAFRRGGDNGWVFGGGTTNDDGVINLLGNASNNFGPLLIGSTGAWGSSTAQCYAGSNSQIKGGTAYNTYTVTAGGTAGGVSLTSGATSWVSASDARLKNVTGKYDNALADIAQLEPVKFTWKSDTENKPQVGVLAQSVEKVVPEAINTMRVDKEDETEYLGVRYTELIPLMIASIQELKAEVDSLKQQLGK